MFYLLGISISIFLGFLLLIKKEKSTADRVLLAWLFFMALHQTYAYAFNTKVIYEYPYLLGLESPMPLIEGVFLYFYVFVITGNVLHKKWSLILHLIPAISTILLLIPFFGVSNEEKIHVFKNNGVGYEWYVIYMSIIVPLSGLLYSGFSLVLIHKYQKKINDHFSNTDKKELQWLRYLSISLGVIWLISIFFEPEIIFGAVVVLVLFIGFFGINQMNIFYSNYTLEDSDVLVDENTASTSKRYAKSGLTHDIANKIYSELTFLMENANLYRNDDLTLPDLANRLGVHPNHLSQVINENEGKNFYNYINSLRIKEFIELASRPENEKYTMISLAYDCGFSTKSTFNKHFKLNTGKAPTVFFNR